MKNARAALLVTALLSLLVVGSLFLYVSSLHVPAMSPAAPGDGSAPETGRLMPPDSGKSLFLDGSHDIVVEHPSGIPAVQGAEAQGPWTAVCGPEGAIVCFPHDPPALADTNFTAAGFSIRQRADLATAEACAAAQSDEREAGPATLAGTEFASFTFGDAAMSHRLEGMSWRTFREGRCYELAQRIETSVFEVWEPGSIREFTASEAASVRAVLESLRFGFRFQDDLDRV